LIQPAAVSHCGVLRIPHSHLTVCEHRQRNREFCLAGLSPSFEEPEQSACPDLSPVARDYLETVVFDFTLRRRFVLSRNTNTLAEISNLPIN
jgi:hypothetical protein